MTVLRRFADSSRSGSIAGWYRARRFALFCSLAERLPRPVRILHVAGKEGLCGISTELYLGRR